ncbi:MAG TPA: signal peptidase I [Hungateiclostridium thermocellum]|nr:signal peptidase I [Acetivibrio thermocellus]CDG35027.1 signal peptidase I [Acetivibrio thermocellus BC1]ADU74926.1 signal peptidase I [Acetivibrio thermocellus DSM 1313]ALX08886.1 signal peptidase I [Acetivibrio thermocellus AD2]ANV76636.1 signal peptidase I [Acetivibrio thermocellus DSM 2360]EIC05118.1 signal peptidase I [Acetivibrio thermocellus YS]
MNTNMDNFETAGNGNSKKQKVFKEIVSWSLCLLGAFIIALLLTKYVIVNAYVPTGSMENTIMPGDRIIASRIHYYFSEPKRGDIVVFRYPDNEEVLYVKRIIGLPNETVEIKDGNVYINGKLLEEPYIKEKAYGDFGPYEVPEGCYFMLGDNRNGSTDSRRWTNKYVKKEKILGKALFKYFPGFKILW